jgi:D-cysteine desulfhydrase family pyridoxal phosphate-dependent enzyme
MTHSLEQLPRSSLANLPTPLQPLPSLSQQLGVELWVKRDDLTGLAFGGNKTRKLDLLAADAVSQSADTLITTGAIQSNHCRQTAAAAARLGLGCSLVLVGNEPDQRQANLLLDGLLGARVHWTDKENQEAAIAHVAEELTSAGQHPYLIPYGGSNHLGVAAYALAMAELLKQDPDFDLIVLASSSGGTQSGLLLGASLYGFEGEILGISIEPPASELTHIIQDLLAQATAAHSLKVSVAKADVRVNDSFLGSGYAVMGELEANAIKRFASLEGLLLDPVYTGRAAGALLQLIQDKSLRQGQRILFWHTGGTPALFAYNQALNL